MEIIIGVIWYIVTFGGLYMIAKEMKHPFPIFAFIPIINFFMILKFAWYWTWFFLVWIFLSGLGVVLPIIWGALFILLWLYIVFRFCMRTTGNIQIAVLTMFFPFVWFYLAGFMLKNKNNKEVTNKYDAVNQRKVRCNNCEKILIISRDIKNVKWKCPKCWNIIEIK